jgi:hypothetical protein
MSVCTTPVAFFIFNRPELTRLSFSAIREARPPRLYVVADGPRASHPQDRELTLAARAIVDDVDWPCQVIANFSDRNLGCKRRIASGLDWVFGQEERAIIIEDDCLVDQSFFPFCDQLLERYEDEPKVHMISGCNVHSDRLTTGASYYFSRCYHIWGWASWARAWRTYDLDMADWGARRKTEWPAALTGDQRVADLARHLFDLSHSNALDQWDFQWVYSGWKRDALAIVPSVNLVKNVGFGPQATHQRRPPAHVTRMSLSSMEFPLNHPSDVATIDDLDAAEWRMAFPHWFSGGEDQRGRLRRLAPWRRRGKAPSS